MAIRGKKPRPSYLKVIEGNRGRRPLVQQRSETISHGALARPAKLRGNARKLWDYYIGKCTWLCPLDGAKALVWVHLQAQFERAPNRMIASRIAQLRALGSELGLDPVSRDRMGVMAGGAARPNPANKYLG
jgi:hypothetical protein